MLLSDVMNVLPFQGWDTETGHLGEDPREEGLRGQKGHHMVLGPPSTSCVTSGKFLHLSET